MVGVIAVLSTVSTQGAAPSAKPEAFIEAHCASCHDDVEKKGDLDLTALVLKPEDPKNFALWVKVHDRVSSGEMPPKNKNRAPALHSGRRAILCRSE